jgi:vitamin K-dependent gamma-carboxylase
VTSLPHSGGAEPAPLLAQSTRLARRLFEGVDIAPLVYFRVVCGLFMSFQALLFVGRGTDLMYVYPRFQFSYFGLSWLSPLPWPGMEVLFWVLVTAGLAIALGLAYRLCAAVFFLGFGYAFFCDVLMYQNHYYLLILLALALTVTSPHRALSIDARLRPALRSSWVPRWHLFLCRFTVAIVYFYGGIAKLSPDWLQGEPLRTYFHEPQRQAALPLLGRWMEQEWLVHFFTYSGLLLDLLIVPAILWRRTRYFALAAILLFHLMNSQLWTIGIFPWFMIFGTLILLPPRLFRGGRVLPAGTAPAAPRTLTRRQLVTLALLGTYAAIHLLLPFRHLLYPGDANWTEEGARFAWRMMLRRKSASRPVVQITDTATGRVELLDYARDPRRYRAEVTDVLVKPLDELYALLADSMRKRVGVEPGTHVTPEKIDRFLRAEIEKQRVYVGQWRLNYLSIKPRAVQRFAHAVAEEYERRGFTKPQVRVRVSNSLNGRPYQLLVDPEVDLAHEPLGLGHASWITEVTREPRPQGPAPGS